MLFYVYLNPDGDHRVATAAEDLGNVPVAASFETRDAAEAYADAGPALLAEVAAEQAEFAAWDRRRIESGDAGDPPQCHLGVTSRSDWGW